jgi:hypothetical protein
MRELGRFPVDAFSLSLISLYDSSIPVLEPSYTFHHRSKIDSHV